ncbi:PREDICTED: putative pentatricopeptide repeat-containing protein At3g01580 [Nelumbo nucifera]|uniref:Pentatricopeptide repeat-containing protein At3g01580 n=2 Tax=Nelumbo nucifera TaxID=4432 RepID=A0A822YEV0_NELNU|nr:PREDICTED: putative pentatricopeptide repeat-containing protein At3g01580 [Nelumbo nucifera]DAD30942.1 TPA_asm: hypothetical protein HUJ06_009793 [Nelumbo nucifera]
MEEKFESSSFGWNKLRGAEKRKDLSPNRKKMVVVSTLSPNSVAFQPSFLIIKHHQLSGRLKVCSNSQNNTSRFYTFITERKLSSVLCNLTLQNLSPIEADDTRPQESASRLFFLKNQSVLDISLANKMIRESTANELFEDAIVVYLQILNNGLPVEEMSCFPCLIKAFGELFDLRKGRQIHGYVLKLGALVDIHVANSLLALYWKCGAAEDALNLFENIPDRDFVSWNTMISGFDQSLQPKQSLEMFRRMMQEFGDKPSRVACLSALSSCTSCGFVIHGQEIHAFLIKNGLDLDPSLVNRLIGMYTKCGNIKNAEHIFESVIRRESLKGNALLWNVMVLGYVYSRYSLKALRLFHDILILGIEPDSSTMVAILVMCSQLSDSKIGRQIHSYIFRFGLADDTRVETALLDMYCKCGDIEAGLKIFHRSVHRNFVIWGAMIGGCVQNGYPEKALDLFAKFRLEGGLADPAIVLSVLRACSSLTLKREGLKIHGLAVKMGYNSNVFVGSALTDMYAKCSDLESAQKILVRLPTRDVISWNALISGFVQKDRTDEAIKAFRDMQYECIRPNTVTISYILTVSARLSVLIFCKQIHSYLIRNRIDHNVLVSNSLIATYSRCGDITSAWHIFKKMSERNEISWNSMISGLGVHGRIDDMLALFDQMKAAGVKPDRATFTAILSACSHTGRVNKGQELFKNMVEDYNIRPELEQYTCMVDLLGRAGHLEQAYSLIMDMPCWPDDRIWGSLLASCKIHGNEELAEEVAKHLFALNSNSVGYHVLLSNIYEGFGKLDNVTSIRANMKDMGLKKRPGCSWIEVNNKIHIFIANDQSHHQSEDIYVTLGNLTVEIKRAGYIPQAQPLGSGYDGVNEDII